MCASDCTSGRVGVPKAGRVSPCMRLSSPLLLSLTLALAWALPSPAHAADREQEQIKRLRLQMRQMQQDQEAAQAAQAQATQAAKATMEASLKAAKNEANATKAAVGAANRQAQALRTEIQALKDEKTALNDKITSLQKDLVELQAKAAKDTAESKSALKAQQDSYSSLSQAHAQCRGDNATLVQLSQDLLQRYEQKGLGEVFSANEPFVQTGRVKLENLAQNYRDRIEGARLSP